MAETQEINSPSNGVGYGYTEDSAAVSANSFSFGLNSDTYLKSFSWIPNGGKDGAEMEALDIVFTIKGTDKSYRMFPLKKVFGKNQEEITDPSRPEFKEAQIDFNARINHILGCFVDQPTLRQAMNRPIRDFKDFCTIAAATLPREFFKIELDIFLQYQWQLGEGKSIAYLEIPKKMKYGRWLSPHQSGDWKAVRKENPSESDARALYYMNAEGLIHPFVKNGWFMLSNFANQVKADGATGAGNANLAASQAMNASTTTAPVPQAGGEAAPTQAW